MDNKLLLAVNFSAIDKLSPALKNIMGGAKGSAAMLSAMKKEASKAEAELKGVRKEIAGAVASGAGLQSLVNRERELAQQARLANAQFDKQQRHMQRIGTIQRRAGKVSDAATIGGGVATAGITTPLMAFGSAAITAAMESRDAIGQVEASLASMGRTAEFSAAQLARMATNEMRQSLYDDDDILRNVTSTMLTFGNVQGPMFARAQSAAVDLSVKFKKDLGSSAVMVGKALQDPIKGVTALSKVGVSFSDDQKAMIKSMVATGNAAGAQMLIMRELEKQVAGSGEAARKADPGAAGRQSFEDMKETVGERLIPIMTKFWTLVGNLADRFNALSPATQEMIIKAGMFAAAIGPILLIVGGMAFGIAALASPLALLTTGFKIAGQAVLWLGRALLMNPIGWLVTAIAVAAYLIYTNWDTIKAAFSAGWAAIKAVAQAGWAWITSSFNTGIAWLSSLPSRFLAFGQNMMSGLINGISNGAQWVKDKIFAIASSIGTWFKSALGINSPSRVFMGFGNYLTQGLALGIDDGAKGPMRSLARLTTGLAAGGALAVSGPVLAARGGPGASASPNRAASASPTPSGPVTINVYGAQGQDVRMLAREVAKHIQGREDVSGRSAYIDV